MINDKYSLENGIGTRVDKIRDLYGDTRKFLAELVNVSPSYMTRLLSDAARWNDEMINIVIEHYHVTEEYLLTGVKNVEEIYEEEHNSSRMVSDIFIYLDEQPKEVQKEYIRQFLHNIMKMIDNL